jgi:hypothetical protein
VPIWRPGALRLGSARLRLSLSVVEAGGGAGRDIPRDDRNPDSDRRDRDGSSQT